MSRRAVPAPRRAARRSLDRSRATGGCAMTCKLLSDAGIVHAPLTAWPVSWAEVARDIGGVDAEPVAAATSAAALERVRRTANGDDAHGRPADRCIHFRVPEADGAAALRRRAARERRDLRRCAIPRRSLRDAPAGDRRRSTPPTARKLQAGRQLRSAVVLGNWMLHAGYIDRWWGPGWEGSLIYGSNSRPIPSITIERNYSDPIDHPWLRWIGQWRFVADDEASSRDERTDAPECPAVRHARDLEDRIQRLEVGFSRTAQWCGDWPPLRPRHVLGPAHRQRQRPAAAPSSRATSSAASTCAGRCPAAGRALCAGDRRKTRPTSCRASTSDSPESSSGAVSASALARARGGRRHDLQLHLGPARSTAAPTAMSIYPRRLPVLRPGHRPLDRRRQPPDRGRR